MSIPLIQSCQVGDVGVQLIVQFLDAQGGILDMSTATALVIKIGKPDGTTEDKAAALLTDGRDGKVVYATVADDLDQAGTYNIQGKADVSGGLKSTALGAFEVVANVDDA